MPLEITGLFNAFLWVWCSTWQFSFIEPVEEQIGGLSHTGWQNTIPQKTPWNGPENALVLLDSDLHLNFLLILLMFVLLNVCLDGRLVHALISWIAQLRKIFTCLVSISLNQECRAAICRWISGTAMEMRCLSLKM